MAIQTLTVLFDRYVRAADAVRRLEAAGVPHGDISLVSNDAAHSQYYGAIPGDDGPMPDEPVGSTGAGASLGTLLGGGAGLLTGLGLLAVPGLGPVAAAGWLASTLVGAGIGAAAGGLVGSLIDVGVSDADAKAYAEGIHRGGTLLTVRVEAALSERVREILEDDDDVAMPTPSHEGARRSMGPDGTLVDQAIMNGVVTGIPVFSDPTMLAPSPAEDDAGLVPAAIHAPSVDVVERPSPDRTTGLGPIIHREGTADAKPPSAAGAAVGRRVGEAAWRSRGRVRIYDRP